MLYFSLWNKCWLFRRNKFCVHFNERKYESSKVRMLRDFIFQDSSNLMKTLQISFRSVGLRRTNAERRIEKQGNKMFAISSVL